MKTAHLYRSEDGQFYTVIMSGNGYDVVYTSETVANRKDALKNPRSFSTLLKPFYVDHTEEPVGNPGKGVKRGMFTDMVYPARKYSNTPKNTDTP